MSRIEVIENFSDPMWRLNNLYFIVDKSAKRVPFRPNTVQETFLKNLWYFNLVLKSRQHGITTVTDIAGLDQALFNDNMNVGICAHKLDAVEEIFETKVKFPYENLPEGLRTAIPADTDSAKKLKFSNGSSISVSTSLRSGTFQFVHISEFGKICARQPDKAKEIVTGTFETVHPGSILVVESTAEGRTGYFFNYVEAAKKRDLEGVKLNKMQFKLHFFAWWQDENNRLYTDCTITKENDAYFDKLESEHGIKLDKYQKAWYQTKDETLEEDMKREHPSTPEEAFEASISGAYLSKQMAKLRRNGQISTVPHDPTLLTNTSWDFGINDKMCIWFHQLGGLQHRIIDYIEGTDEDVLYYWREIQSKGYNLGTHFLPHDADTRRVGTAKTADDKPQSLKTILEDAGMRNIKVVPKIENKWTAIQESKLFIVMCYFDKKMCSVGIDGLDNFKRDWDDKLGDWKNNPLKNWAIHSYDSFETLARGMRLFGCGTNDIGIYKPKRNIRPRRA